MRGIRWLLLAGGVLLISLLWHWPAAHLLPALLPQNIRLAAVEGPWHQGEAILLVGAHQAAGRIHWNLQLWRLLTGEVGGRIAWSVDAEHTVAGRVGWRPYSNELIWSALTGRVPLSVLRTGLPQVQPLQPAGVLILTDVAGRLSLATVWPRTLAGRLQWHEGRLMGMSLGLPLTVAWQTGADDRITGHISGQSEAGQLAGTIVLAPNRRVRYVLQFSPGTGTPPPWVNMVFTDRQSIPWRAEGEWTP